MVFWANQMSNKDESRQKSYDLNKTIVQILSNLPVLEILKKMKMGIEGFG